MIMQISGHLTPAYKQFLQMGRANPDMTILQLLARCGR